MKIKKMNKTQTMLFALSAILIASIGMTPAFGQILDPIVVMTDKESYSEGEKILITGELQDLYDNKIPIIVRAPNANIISITQVDIGADKKFSTEISTGGALMQVEGTYTITAYYQDEIAETSFNYTFTELDETTGNFEVDTGSVITFDVEYAINGATIENMEIDWNILALVVTIDATEEGYITLYLPREFIGAETQDGCGDDTFIILIDGIEVAYQESLETADFRIITINFEEGELDIEIIGTYVMLTVGDIIEFTDTFEVEIDGGIPFNVDYTIEGGTIQTMALDVSINALVITIDATEDGTISLFLPREFIGSENPDGTDGSFVVIIYGRQVDYLESFTDADFRVITFDFEDEDSYFEIIGTYVTFTAEPSEVNTDRVKIPNELKEVLVSWSNGHISDDDLLNSIKLWVNSRIITIE